MFDNVRGFKSKDMVIKRIIDEEGPVLIALAETKLNKEDKLSIDNYVVRRNDRVEEGGGVLIAYKKSLKHMITTVFKYNQYSCEMLWVKLNNGLLKIRIGVVYMPQESRTLLKDIKEIYKTIDDQVKKAAENGEKVLVLGDLNCKIGCEIPGNTTDLSKGGRVLLNIANKNNLKILNTTKCCNGLWTRHQDGEDSVLDYVLVRDEDLGLVNSMTIDEKRDITPYSLDYSDGSMKRTYTDHFMITCMIDWKTSEQQRKQKSVLDKDKVESYMNELEKENVSKIIDDRPIRTSYSEWANKVLEIRDKYSKRRKIRRKWKVERFLAREKKKITRELKLPNQHKERIEELKVKKALLMDLIDEEQRVKQFTRVNKIVADVQEAGGVDSTTFWKVRSRLLGKSCETADAMEDDEGVLHEDPEEIREIYVKHFEKLLQRPTSESTEGKEAEV